MTVKTLKFNLDVNGFGSVTLDGVPIECRSISLKATAGDLTEVNIGLFVKVDGEIMIDELVSKGPKPWPPASKGDAA
jgi:hypothetical protein